jgi:RNA polymerase sigma-70 factor (ECF subfamily)
MFERTATPWPKAREERVAHTDESQDRVRLTVLHRNRAALIHFLYRMVQDEMVAEELAIEVFQRFYRSCVRPGPVAHSAARLFRIAADLALREPPNAVSQPPAGLSDAPDVARAVACLSGKQRAAMLMHKYHQMDCWQIAQVLNCSESVARSMLLSAYENLRRRLAPRTACQSENCAAR